DSSPAVRYTLSLHDALPICVLNVHVRYIRQVTHVAGHDHVELVLHGPRLAAITHPQITLALVGAKGHEQDLHALIRQMPRQFRKDRKSTRLNSSHVKISYAV